MRAKTEKTGNDFVHNIVINGAHIRIKSVFSGNIPLEKALKNIVMRRLSEEKKDTHKACS